MTAGPVSILGGSCNKIKSPAGSARDRILCAGAAWLSTYGRARSCLASLRWRRAAPTAVGSRRGRRDYGYSSSPLLLGGVLVVEVGDNEGTFMAYDKRRGKRIWRSRCSEPACHNGGPVPMTVEGVPCVASLGICRFVVVRTDRGHEGETVGTYQWATDYANNIATPAVDGNRVILTSAYNQKRSSLLEVTLKGIRRKWIAREYSGVASPVIYKNRVYMADRSFVCLDYGSRRTRWKGGRFSHGSCLVTAGDAAVLTYSAKAWPAHRRTASREADPLWRHAPLRLTRRGRAGVSSKSSSHDSSSTSDSWAAVLPSQGPSSRRLPAGATPS